MCMMHSTSGTFFIHYRSHMGSCGAHKCPQLSLTLPHGPTQQAIAADLRGEVLMCYAVLEDPAAPAATHPENCSGHAHRRCG